MQVNTTNNRFIGTKIVLALAMNRAAYNGYRGWPLPSNENGDDEGYLVEYTDGGKPNVQGHAGYVSWSPKEQFDNAYRRCDALPFGLAIQALKKGAKVARAGWNGKGMFVYLVPANAYPASTAAAREFFGADALVPYNAYLALKGVDGTVSTWAPSCSDALADDWQIIADDRAPGNSLLTQSEAFPQSARTDTSEAAIEREIQAKGLTAPRLLPADLTANIAHTEIVRHLSHSGQVLRWAILTTLNGFAVVGKPSVAVSPENDNAEIGEKVAIENSRTEMWPLMGYQLREELHRAACEHALLHGEVAR